MKATVVDHHDGSTWTVRRRVEPWRNYFSPGHRTRRPSTAEEWNTRSLANGLSWQASMGNTDALVGMLERAGLLVMLPFTILFRLLTLSSWWVEVTHEGQLRHEEKAGRWGASGDRVQELVHQLETGHYTFDRRPTS